MEQVQPRGHVEATTFETLRERGWAIVGGRRAGVDLDLSVEHEGTPGLVRFRSGIEPAPGVASAEPAPLALRVDLGDPGGEPSRWAVWDRYSFPGGKNTPSYVALVVHEAIAEGWASVAGCSVAPKSPWYDRFSAIATILARAEALSPSRSEASRRAQIFVTGRSNFGVQRQHWKNVLAASLLLPLGGALWAATAHVATGAAPSAAARTVAMAISGLPALAFSAIGLGSLVSLLRVPRRPLNGMAAVVESMRATSAFSTFALTPLKRREGLPVPVRSGGHLQEGSAPLSLSRLTATSPAHEIALEADLCRIAWPEGVLAGTRFVPERWLTVDLTGNDSDLARLPEGPREERAPGVVRWTFTGAELDDATFADQIQKLAAALAPSGSPYR